MAAVSLALELLVMISIGIFIVRRGIIGRDFETSLTSLMINITLPCMIVQSLNMPFSMDQLKTCGTLLGLSLLLLALYAILGQVLYRVAGRGARGRAFRFGTIFTNFTFMGLPVMESLYGQEGLFAFVVFVIPFRIAYYSSAKPLLSPVETGQRTTLSSALKGFVTPPVVAALLGLVFFFLQITFPAPADHLLSQIGGVSSPLGMMLCGISLGSFSWRDIRAPRHLTLPLIRNLMLPALTAGLMILLPVDPMIKAVVTVFAALPVASLLAAFTIQFDPDPHSKLESAGAVFFSTLLSIVTVPLWSYLAERLFLS